VGWRADVTLFELTGR